MAENEEKTEKQPPEKKNTNQSTENLRFKYIGFDVFPKKIKEFWKSEEEKRKYVEKVKKHRKESPFLLERDHSLVFTSALPKVDRVILSISSALLVVGLFFPWFSITAENGSDTSLIGLSFLFNFNSIAGVAFLSGFLSGLFSLLLLGTVTICFVFGIISLLSIYTRTQNEDEYYRRLKKVLALGYIPLLFFVGSIIIAVVGLPSSLGTAFGKSLEAKFNVIDYLGITKFGFWISFACVFLNVVKGRDL